MDKAKSKITAKEEEEVDKTFVWPQMKKSHWMNWKIRWKGKWNEFKSWKNMLWSGWEGGWGEWWICHRNGLTSPYIMHSNWLNKEWNEMNHDFYCKLLTLKVRGQDEIDRGTKKKQKKNVINIWKCNLLQALVDYL